MVKNVVKSKVRDNVRKRKSGVKKHVQAKQKISEQVEQKQHKDKKHEKQASKTVVKKPVVNIGLFGHVDHGKTTLTEKITGKWTDTHSEELRRGITIRLGYADASFYKCPKCPEPQCYTTTKVCKHCGAKTNYLRTVSFVDAPGHESLMATMIAGATIIDGALLLIAANEDCPQPQTREHLMALQILGIKNVVVVQNKIDLVTEEQALKNYEQIKAFLKTTDFANAPIIPISAQHGANIDVLIQAIEDVIKTPKRNLKAKPLFLVARSFDINKPGSNVEALKGGVLGGSLIRGMLKKGDEIEIRPGIVKQYQNSYKSTPINTKIISIAQTTHAVEELTPGGTAAIQTTLFPTLTKGDGLMGCVVGIPKQLPPVWNSVKLKVNLLQRIVGTAKELEVESIKLNETLLLNVNSATTLGVVNKLEDDKITVSLKIPVCSEKGARFTISRPVFGRYRLIGYGILEGGVKEIE